MVKENHYKKVPKLMRMRKNRHLHCPAGIVFSAIHDIKKYTFSHYNTIKKRYDTNPGQRGCLLKKADFGSVCFDGEQTHWVNRLQCVRLLFLRCITATPQRDELATLLECVPPKAKLCWEWLRRDIPYMAAESLWAYAEAWVCCSIM